MSVDLCKESPEDFAGTGFYDTVITSVIISLLILIAAASVMLVVLLWLRNRIRKPELVNNVACQSQNCEIRTDAMTSVGTSNATTMNQAYAATDETAPPAPIYQSVVPSREGEDIATATNMAYGATNILGFGNCVYHPTPQNSNHCTPVYNNSDLLGRKHEYDYPRWE